VIDRAMVKAARAWRSVAGEKTAIEKYVKRRYRRAVHKEAGRHASQFSGPNEVVIRARRDPENKTGVFLKGGCDLPTLFLMGPMIRDDLRAGTVAILRPPESVGSSHSSQLLESAAGVSMDLIEETCRRLEISRAFFKPVLFEERFGVKALPKVGDFPKTVVALSIASDLTRSLHRHREHGFLIDIGGWWLNQSLEKAIKDVDTLRWFKDNFEAVGRIGVDEFQSNFETIVRRLHDMGSQAIVLNSLGLDPQNLTHNYQLLNADHATRRREFNAAIAESSAKIGFHVLDVDRSLKLQGVKEQVDFAHASLEAKLPIARECYRILRELEIF
jgi:hypothetical protein